MKPYILGALALLLLCAPVFSQTTPNLSFNIPSAGSNVGTWGPLINSNFSTLDLLLSGNSPVTISPTIKGGVGNNGSGLKHARTTSCTTAASLNAQCSTVVTWGTPFADGNYTVTATMGTGSGGGCYVLQSANPIAASVTISITNYPGSAGACSGTLNVIAIHD